MAKKIIGSPILVFVAMLVFALVASPTNSIRENFDGPIENHYKSIEYVATRPGRSSGMGHDMVVAPVMRDVNQEDHYKYIKYVPTKPGPSPGMGHGMVVSPIRRAIKT